MSKTTSGFILVGGLLLIPITSAVCGISHSYLGGTPASDVYHDMIGYAGVVSWLTGVALFFFGALRFSRG